MFDSVNKRFDLIIANFKKNNFDTSLITKAYQFADWKHNGILRKDGNPYISHPVEVALILAEHGFDEDVVSAALLHDVVEDCDVSIKEIEEKFNKNVAELVDCVSAIDKTKYVLNHEDIFEDENFFKASVEEQSFKKLIKIGKQNPNGFCIKFADRLHNLRTIEIFTYNKQLEKVKETEKWILPIAKKLNSNYFYQEIKNECFKIIHKKECENFLNMYKIYHKNNFENLQNIIQVLNEIFVNKMIKSIEYDEVKEFDVFRNLQYDKGIISVSKISDDQILCVPNYNIYLLYSDSNWGELLKQVINLFKNRLRDILKIIDTKFDDIMGHTYFVAEDSIKNKYNIYILNANEFVEQQSVALIDEISNVIDDDELDDLSSDLIKVKTRSGEIKYIQKGSSVLDFAFKIHKDIGLGFKYAIINDSKTQNPPYTKLLENDTVEIIVDKNENGTIKNNAQIKWFAYVQTELAKKCLVKYFEQIQSKK